MTRFYSGEPSRRQLRVGEQLRHILFEIFQRSEVYDLSVRTDRMTLSEVRISPDLKVATIFVSFISTPEENVAILIKQLNAKARLIRGRISPSLKQMKHIPELRFCLDKSYNHVARINTILHSLKLKDTQEAIGTSEETQPLSKEKIMRASLE